MGISLFASDPRRCSRGAAPQGTSELDYSYLMDIAAVDHLGQDPRFEVIYNFYSLHHGHRVRIHVRVPRRLSSSIRSIPCGRPPTGSSARRGPHGRQVPRASAARAHTHARRVRRPSAAQGLPLRRAPRLSRTYDLFLEEKQGRRPPSSVAARGTGPAPSARRWSVSEP